MTPCARAQEFAFGLPADLASPAALSMDNLGASLPSFDDEPTLVSKGSVGVTVNVNADLADPGIGLGSFDCDSFGLGDSGLGSEFGSCGGEGFIADSALEAGGSSAHAQDVHAASAPVMVLDSDVAQLVPPKVTFSDEAVTPNLTSSEFSEIGSSDVQSNLSSSSSGYPVVRQSLSPV